MKTTRLFLTIAFTLTALAATAAQVERWDIFEATLQGPASGNPFLDTQLSAQFKQGMTTFSVPGFYDGNGTYKIRFMPNATGDWTYTTQSNRPQLDGKKGKFTCAPAAPDNHGPMRVHNTYQLAYEDGTPHFSVGTTCYAWAHQGDQMEEQTLRTLDNAPFNKMRMCVFPKSYTYNENEPVHYPYEGTPKKDWDFKRPNPEFWAHFELRVQQLRDRGIEADIILFHTYDRWDFENMGHENNLFFIKYAVARLAAYRNVWWSFANEYDLLKWPIEHWHEYMQLVQNIDPYNHLRGIHNCREFYDHTKPWVTHSSIQNSDFTRAKEYRDTYGKPAIYDECKYEGNIPKGWGNISAQQMSRNFWMGSLAGCYVGHGETYKHPQDLLWWAKGGTLRGQSPTRIQFMKDIIESLPFQDMQPDFSNYPQVYILAQKAKHYLIFFPGKDPVNIDLPGNRPYKIDGIDTWNMKTLPIGTASPGKFTFTPPTRDYALYLTPYAPGENIRPEAKATANISEGIAPLTVNFNTPWNEKVHWDFGDGTTSNKPAPSHTFNTPE
jgi:hypothetical protein